MLKNEEPLQKHTLNLFEGDYERLRQYYGDVGAGPVVRRLVRSWLNQLETKSQSDLDMDVEVKL